MRSDVHYLNYSSIHGVMVVFRESMELNEDSPAVRARRAPLRLTTLLAGDLTLSAEAIWRALAAEQKVP